MGAPEQRRADAAPPGRRQHRDAELGVRPRAREVRGPGKMNGVLVHGEDHVAVEVEPRDVFVDACVRKDVAEPKPAVLTIELFQVRREFRALRAGQLSRDDCHGGSTSTGFARFVPAAQAACLNASRAAASVASRSASSCADETKPAS